MGSVETPTQEYYMPMLSYRSSWGNHAPCGLLMSFPWPVLVLTSSFFFLRAAYASGKFRGLMAVCESTVTWRPRSLRTYSVAALQTSM